VTWWKGRTDPKSKRSSSDSERDDPKAREQLKTEERRAYKTYRARQSAANRLGRRARAWNWALIAFSTSTTIAAIGMLTDPDMYGANGDTLMVCLAILVLVASLTTSNMDYSGRSRDMFINYRKLQRISVEMEELRNQLQTPVTEEMVKELSRRHQAILDETENHTTGDHLRHFSRTLLPDDPHHSTDDNLYKMRRRAMLADFLITSTPYATLLVPVALVVPLMQSLLP
jgi:SMODS and SLOG-associating 2TM effector domain family 5